MRVVNVLQCQCLFGGKQTLKNSTQEKEIEKAEIEKKELEEKGHKYFYTMGYNNNKIKYIRIDIKSA